MEWHQSLYLTIKGTLPTELWYTLQRISENAQRIPDTGLSSEGLDHSTQPRPPLMAYHSLQKSLSLPTLEQQVNTCNSLWEKSLQQMFIDSDRVRGTLVFSKVCLFSLAMALKSLCNFVSICKMGVMIAQWQVTICCICEVVQQAANDTRMAMHSPLL